MNLQEFLNCTLSFISVGNHSYQDIRPRLLMNDGASMSVQASEAHYSSPRLDGEQVYACVEVGYPDFDIPATWLRYEEGWGYNDTTGIFCYIPVELVEDVINAHGGIKVPNDVRIPKGLI